MAQRPDADFSAEELLRCIRQGLPDALARRYRGLIASRQQESLTPEEHAELLLLTERVELIEAGRADALVRLAQIRQVRVTEVLRELDRPGKT